MVIYMSINFELLDQEFADQIQQLLEKAKEQGYEMRPYTGVRTPFEQAKLWRQSRSVEQITKQIALFKQNNAHFLAHCLESVGPQNGDHVTNALPGFSWHQWGEAVDCFWLVNEEAVWSSSKKINGKNGYAVYAEIGDQLKLTPGGYFTSLKDWPHMQKRKGGSPLAAGLSTLSIDKAMKDKFS